MVVQTDAVVTTKEGGHQQRVGAKGPPGKESQMTQGNIVSPDRFATKHSGATNLPMKDLKVRKAIRQVVASTIGLILIGALTVGSTAASTQSGKVGPYRPGVVNCSAEFPTLTVTPMSVWAHNTTAFIDVESVVVGYFLEKWDGSKWIAVASSPTQAVTARDNYPGMGSAFTFTITSAGYYRGTSYAVWSSGWIHLDTLEHRITAGAGTMFHVLASGRSFCQFGR